MKREYERDENSYERERQQRFAKANQNWTKKVQLKLATKRKQHVDTDLLAKLKRKTKAHPVVN